MKRVKILFILLVVSLMFIPSFVYAAPEMPPGEDDSNFSYAGATTFYADKTESDKTYSSAKSGVNALLVSGGTNSIKSCTVTKSGDSDGDSADFYGVNAAILVYNGAKLDIADCTINTNGNHANAVFSYQNGTINISDTTISTSANNSGGLMVTGGGLLNADNLTVTTSGNSSAAIRSDRGGGSLLVNNGVYETSGVGSPAIYSTAKIVANNAALTSNSSEGVVVEGANSVELNSCQLVDTNTTLNGNSETYKNIFLYQSMSGDADSGTASFVSKNSNITTNKGDTIFVTNTTATIELESNEIINSDGDFLRIQAGKWGNSGSNGGDVTLSMSKQQVTGGIIVDSISKLDLSLADGSVLVSAIDTENQGGEVKLKLTEDSVLSLTGDTYVDSLENSDTNNSNIYSNGQYKLYVKGEEVEINSDSYVLDVPDDVVPLDNNSGNMIVYFIVGGVIFLIVLSGIVVFFLDKRKQKNNKVM